MNKLNKFLVSSLIVTASLVANTNTNKEEVDLSLKEYKNIHAIKKIDNILKIVKEEGIIKDKEVNAIKWQKTNKILHKLIKHRNYDDAYVLFKHINFDQNIEKYKSYLTFFQILNKMESKHSDFKNVNLIHDNFLLNHLFYHFFELVEKEKINDKTILSKIEFGLLDIENKYLNLSEKQRIRYKIDLLKGKYLEALTKINSIKKLDLIMEDKRYKKNIKNVLLFMQEHFFTHYLNMSHKDFKNYNLLYRTNQKIECN